MGLHVRARWHKGNVRNMTPRHGAIAQCRRTQAERRLQSEQQLSALQSVVSKACSCARGASRLCIAPNEHVNSASPEPWRPAGLRVRQSVQGLAPDTARHRLRGQTSSVMNSEAGSAQGGSPHGRPWDRALLDPAPCCSCDDCSAAPLLLPFLGRRFVLVMICARSS